MITFVDLTMHEDSIYFKRRTVIFRHNRFFLTMHLIQWELIIKHESYTGKNVRVEFN